jgi:hypothetical protein
LKVSKRRYKDYRDDPAGQVGNELPILVSESWYSPVAAVVLSKHSDPRMGETTIALQGSIAANKPVHFSRFQPTTRLRKVAQSFSGSGTAKLNPATS